jgi:NADPH-dependent 2,4-dienoyl-CoA reductase/sulfur reductase-like enzyme
MEDLVVRHARVFREKQGIDLRTGHRVQSIDPAAKTGEGATLEGKGFDFSYDKLLIATGTRANIPDLPGFDLPGVFTLKSLEDGRRIKELMAQAPVKKVVIVGMGYIALEMCEALRERGVEVDMVKPRPVFIPWMNQDLASVVRQEVEANGVNVHPGHEIRGIERGAGGLRVICSDMKLEAQMVIVGTGVSPCSELASKAGLELGPSDSVAVDRALLTSHKDIYAAGDCADAYHVVTGKKTWIPLALRANRSGWAVADNVTGRRVELPGVVGTAVFKVFDMQVARTGLSVEEAERHGFEPAETVIKSRSRAHAHPGTTDIWVQIVGDKKTGKLLGAQMVGKEGAAHRINAAAVALHAGMTVEAFSQSDLAYAPPFGPTWDPLLTAANQVLKKME